MNTIDNQSAPSEFKVQSSAFNVQSSPFSGRLIPLSDGRPGLRGTMHVDVREPSLSSFLSAIASATADGGEGQGEEAVSASTLDFISSDETLDRYGEIITAS